MNNHEVMRDVNEGRFAVIASRTVDPQRRQIAGSTPWPCCHCNAEVMISPATRERMTELSIVLCRECAIAEAERRGEKWIDPGRSQKQLAELRANGHRA